MRAKTRGNNTVIEGVSINLEKNPILSLDANGVIKILFLKKIGAIKSDKSFVLRGVMVYIEVKTILGRTIILGKEELYIGMGINIFIVQNIKTARTTAI